MSDSITKFEDMKNEIPTLKQVKEYFKNAREVKCLFYGRVFNIAD